MAADMDRLMERARANAIGDVETVRRIAGELGDMLSVPPVSHRRRVPWGRVSEFAGHCVSGVLLAAGLFTVVLAWVALVVWLWSVVTAS